MYKIRKHPKNQKCCAFCNRWMGQVNFTFVSNTVGYEFEGDARGKCAKNNFEHKADQSASGCPFYTPNIAAQKLL